MEQDKKLQLLRSYQAAAESSIEQAEALPFPVYIDNDVYQVESESIFHQDWVFGCAEQQIPEPGDYFSLNIAGEPVIVVHSSDGQYRALSNTCRHRGTPLLDEGFGKLKRLIVCPYHAWSYDDQGKLKGVPFPGGIEIDKTAHCLSRFHLQSWKGLLFVHLGEDPEPLSERLHGLETYLQVFDIERFDKGYSSAPEHWQANWKLAVENGIESYHLFKVHKDTLEKITPTKQAFYVAGSSEWAVTGGKMKDLRSTLSKWLSGDYPEAYNHYVLVFLPPSFVGVLTYGSFEWIQVLPDGARQCVVNAGGISQYEAQDEKSSEMQFFLAFLAEDKWICERVQKGMQARRGKGGKLVELEKILVDFRQYLTSRLFGSPVDKFTETKEAKVFYA